MNFEIGEVLSRAMQITWRHKHFWAYILLPMLVGFLAFPLLILPLFFWGDTSPGSTPFFNNPIFLILFFGLHVAIGLASFILSAIGYSSLTLGIVRVDRGEETLTFKGLLQDGMKYFPRMLGMLLLLGVGFSLVFVVIFFGVVIFGAVTAGIGFICAQPLILAMYPVMIVVYAFMEQSQAAIVADDLGIAQAILKGWELLKVNFWRLVLISLIVYIGIGIASSVITLPFMLPVFFLPFLFDSSFFDSGPRYFVLLMAGYMLLLLPVFAFVQGVTITFMKSTYVVVYLRLTKPPQIDAPMAQEANA